MNLGISTDPVRQPMQGGPFYVIEKGVPIPPPTKRGRPSSVSSEVWAFMEVGDSALFPTQVRVRAAMLWGALNGRRFRQVKVPRVGWRVWRTA